MQKKKITMNEDIKGLKVMLIKDGGDAKEISTSDALQMAEDAGLDLVLVSKNGNGLPVVKIVDGNKYAYEQKQKEKERRKNSKSLDVKEIRISPNIAEYDLNIKTAAARKFLEKGHEVKFTLVCRGREISRIAMLSKILNDVAGILSDISIVKSPVKPMGKTASCLLSPKK